MNGSTESPDPVTDGSSATYREGVRAAVPLALVVGIFGVSWGVLAGNTGMSVSAALVMSSTTFGASAQFAAVSILANGGGVGAAVVAAVLLNARYGPIALSVAPVITGNAGLRLLQSHLVIDESWALANRGGGRFDRRMLVGAGAVMYVAWVGGTAAGIVAGNLLGDPASLGLDAAFPALFVALLAPQVRKRRPVAAAVLGAAIALALVPFARTGIPIMAAAAACLLGLRKR
jgi:predicted branched-subunit amino acid permease